MCVCVGGRLKRKRCGYYELAVDPRGEKCRILGRFCYLSWSVAFISNYLESLGATLLIILKAFRESSLRLVLIDLLKLIL